MAAFIARQPVAIFMTWGPAVHFMCPLLFSAVLTLRWAREGYLRLPWSCPTILVWHLTGHFTGFYWKWFHTYRLRQYWWEQIAVSVRMLKKIIFIPPSHITVKLCFSLYQWFNGHPHLRKKISTCLKNRHGSPGSQSELEESCLSITNGIDSVWEWPSKTIIQPHE